MSNGSKNVLLAPIEREPEAHKRFAGCDACQEMLKPTLEYYRKVGFASPWIGYFAFGNGQWVGTGAFKGAPQQGKVEIAYSTFPKHRHRGWGRAICAALLQIALQAKPIPAICARTRPELNFSTRILEANGFHWVGWVNDPEDGEVWEWIYGV